MLRCQFEMQNALSDAEFENIFYHYTFIYNSISNSCFCRSRFRFTPSVPGSILNVKPTRFVLCESDGPLSPRDSHPRHLVVRVRLV